MKILKRRLSYRNVIANWSGFSSQAKFLNIDRSREEAMKSALFQFTSLQMSVPENT